MLLAVSPAGLIVSARRYSSFSSGRAAVFARSLPGKSGADRADCPDEKNPPCQRQHGRAQPRAIKGEAAQPIADRHWFRLRRRRRCRCGNCSPQIGNLAFEKPDLCGEPCLRVDRHAECVSSTGLVCRLSGGSGIRHCGSSVAAHRCRRCRLLAFAILIRSDRQANRIGAAPSDFARQ